MCATYVQVPKGRSLSMRQPSSGRRAYNDYGYVPKTAAPSSRTGSTSATPDIVVNGHSNDNSVDPVGPATRHRGVSENTRLGQAANPNRSDMPAIDRRKSHDQAASLVSVVT